MPSIPFISPVSYLRTLALMFRFFLVIAALQITTIDKISVKEQPKTWRLVVALMAIVIGLVTFEPFLSRAYSQTSTQTPPSAAKVTEPLTPPGNAVG